MDELCLMPMGLTVTEAAAALGVSRKTLSAILNGRAGISPEMAVRLSIALDTTAESWLNQQVQYDLWKVERRRKKLRVKLLAACRNREEVPGWCTPTYLDWSNRLLRGTTARRPRRGGRGSWRGPALSGLRP